MYKLERIPLFPSFLYLKVYCKKKNKVVFFIQKRRFSKKVTSCLKNTLQLRNKSIIILSKLNNYSKKYFYLIYLYWVPTIYNCKISWKADSNVASITFVIATLICATCFKS